MSFMDAIHEQADRMKRKDDKIRFEKGLQLSLGSLIEKLEDAGTEWGSDGKTHQKKIRLDCGFQYPHQVGSYRGFYQDLAIRYSDDHEERVTAKEFLNVLKDAVGQEFTGYKGGDFEMTEETPVWVANVGNSTSTAISGVRQTATRIILETRVVGAEEMEGEEV